MRTGCKVFWYVSFVPYVNRFFLIEVFVFLKANELLDTAKKATDKYEKERTLQEATRVCWSRRLQRKKKF